MKYLKYVMLVVIISLCIVVTMSCGNKKEYSFNECFSIELDRNENETRYMRETVGNNKIVFYGIYIKPKKKLAVLGKVILNNIKIVYLKNHQQEVININKKVDIELESDGNISSKYLQASGNKGGDGFSLYTVLRYVFGDDEANALTFDLSLSKVVEMTDYDVTFEGTFEVFE